MDKAPLIEAQPSAFPAVAPQPQAQPAYPQPQAAYVQAQPAYPQPQAAYVQAQPAYPQPQAAYPQAQVAYPQAQPVYPQQTGLVLTAELKDFFGYVKCLRIYSIICIISMIFAFPALIFVWYPIIGMNVSKKWNSSSFGCFWCFTLFNLVCGAINSGYYLFICFTGGIDANGNYVDGTAFIPYFIYSLICLLVVFWITRIAYFIKNGLDRYQINDIMAKASYTKLYNESNVPCKAW